MDEFTSPVLAVRDQSRAGRLKPELQHFNYATKKGARRLLTREMEGRALNVYLGRIITKLVGQLRHAKTSAR